MESNQDGGMFHVTEMESEKFENGIMAGDLDSLLEMFEEAESVLSSSVGCISLAHNDSSNHLESENVSQPPYQNIMSIGNTSTEMRLAKTLSGAKLDDKETSSVTSVEIVPIETEWGGASQYKTESTCGNVPSCSQAVPESESFDNSFDRNSEILETCNSAVDDSVLVTNVVDVQFLSSVSEVENVAVENAEEAIPSPSAAQRKDDSETSSDWDDNFPYGDKWSDSSSSPTSADTSPRGRGQFTRKDQFHRRQGRGRVKPVDEDKLYDRLPSYYTVFSRPNRTATGLIRSSRSCLKLVLNSEKYDSPPEGDDEGFDKVPFYQSCFTNSTRYDEDEIGKGVNFEDVEAFDLMERSSRGHGSGSSYTYTRPRYRSRSRLRVGMSPRRGRSGRTAPQAATMHAAFENNTDKEPSGCSVVDTTQQKTKQKDENLKQERRIVHVGRIPATLTAERLREMFEQFGQIEKCTTHYRECGDNYGFVTYVNAVDACKAVEGGFRLPGCQNFDICFGGRRKFCQADYFDLDGNVEMEEELAPVISKLKTTKHNFDDLLMDELLKRKLQ